jgi:pyridoxal phosphate enzyme (YggS family)
MPNQPSAITPPADTTTLSSRYRDVMSRVSSAAERSGRTAADVIVVAVTKHAEPAQIRELIELGHADFGENRVQHLVKRVAHFDEFIERHRMLTSSKPVRIPERIRWHMIGHLQRNKVKMVLDLVTLIHSVDTLRLAEEIQEWGMRRDKTVDVLLQVNCSLEKSKFGVALPAALHLADLIDTMIYLRLRGLMTMAPHTDDQESIRGCFERCRDCFEDIRKAGIGGKDFNLLSMGMSNDFEIGIECGANLVRVGSAIFNEESPAPPGPSDSPAAPAST